MLGATAFAAGKAPFYFRVQDLSSNIDQGIHAVSTWDKELIRERGLFIGEEAKQLGIHVMLGPVAGPLGKVVTGGRNWEGEKASNY